MYWNASDPSCRPSPKFPFSILSYIGSRFPKKLAHKHTHTHTQLTVSPAEFECDTQHNYRYDRFQIWQ
jgi:hypothetical protein